jgi:mannose-6-phosphate isomerase-like protein (cupin superfamily)
MKRRYFLQNSLLAPTALHLSTEPTTERPTKGIGLKDGVARNNEKINVAGTPVDFKLLSTDTNGDLAVFVSANNRKGNGPPLHVHQKLDEFFCVLEGEFAFQVGDEKTLLKPGDTMFVPRTVTHCFDCVSQQPGKLLVTIQPASNMEAFFREMGKLLPEQGAPDMAAIAKLYRHYDSAIVGPPLGVK